MRFSIALTATFAICATTVTFAAPPPAPGQLQQLKKNLAKAASEGKKVSSYTIHVVQRPTVEQQQQQKSKAQLQRRGQYDVSDVDPSILDELASNPILNSLLDKYGSSQDAGYGDAYDTTDTLPAIEGIEEDQEEEEQPLGHHGKSSEDNSGDAAEEKSPQPEDDDEEAESQLRRRQLDSLGLQELLDLISAEGLL